MELLLFYRSREHSACSRFQKASLGDKTRRGRNPEGLKLAARFFKKASLGDATRWGRNPEGSKLAARTPREFGMAKTAVDVEMPPPDVIARGMQDMEAGARCSVQLAFDMWRAGRMQIADLDELLRSFAWQSTELRGWFDVVDRKRDRKRQNSPIPHPETAMLALEDMAALMEGATQPRSGTRGRAVLEAILRHR